MKALAKDTSEVALLLPRRAGSSGEEGARLAGDLPQGVAHRRTAVASMNLIPFAA